MLKNVNNHPDYKPSVADYNVELSIYKFDNTLDYSETPIESEVETWLNETCNELTNLEAHELVEDHKKSGKLIKSLRTEIEVLKDTLKEWQEKYQKTKDYLNRQYEVISNL